ncbi:sushi, von Willebrand factor type A, EGF and pentraxin domain-containing protein 1-like [Dreissena polymorpha]|uniref:sushi, von Willebrand factor type A, EGF and pentraxin domain-containing protein 1-like n=1 Tax=Dreissena polymorpha TaxID=45954 RepID=UPI002264A7AE|nr:sushi, von Willebrand factor type A, EGF and pentraxin domain-containing protein 1-like [Dreissena polymorpha]
MVTANMAWSFICSSFLWILIDHRGNVASQNCGANLHGDSGSFYAPFYPNNYNNNEDCVYRIVVATGHKVCVIMNNFECEGCCDYLDLHDGQTTSAVLKRFMNRLPNENEPVCSSGNQLTAVWHTDFSVVNRGFFAQLISVVDQCMGTPSIPNGIVSQQNVTEVFHLTCLPCGNWTFAECNPVDCRLPPQISNGHLATYSSTLYPSIIKLQCDPGYVLRNQDFMQCQSNGSWSLVLCSLIDCGLPPSLANGMVALRNNLTTFTSQAEVSCNPGYFLNGSYSIIHRTTQGRWTQDSFKCLPVALFH